MNEISKGQELYLKNCRKHKRIVQISRILILFSFLFLWEFTANTGIIDSFIFSSPSKIALCVRNMAADKSIFLHIGITLYETIVSFLLVIMISVLVAVALWFSVYQNPRWLRFSLCGWALIKQRLLLPVCLLQSSEVSSICTQVLQP